MALIMMTDYDDSKVARCVEFGFPHLIFLANSMYEETGT